MKLYGEPSLPVAGRCDAGGPSAKRADRCCLVGGREKTTAEAATMSDKSVTGDDEIDLALITLALMESNFDLDKVEEVQRLGRETADTRRAGPSGSPHPRTCSRR